MRSLARRALALYPPHWRARYGEDVVSFLDDLSDEGRSALPAFFSLLFGAIRLRLTGSGTPQVATAWLARSRAAISTAALPVVLVLPLLVSEWSTSYTSGARPLSAMGVVAEDASTVFALVALAAIVTLLSGWAILVNLVDDVDPGSRRRFSLLVASPFALLVVGFGILALTANVAAFGWLRPAGFVVVWSTCAAAAALVVASGRLAPASGVAVTKGARVSVVLATLTTLLFLVLLVHLVAIDLQSGVGVAARHTHTPRGLRPPVETGAFVSNSLVPLAPLWLTLAFVASVVSLTAARAATLARRTAARLSTAGDVSAA